MQAKEERRHIIFPLEVVVGMAHWWNRSGKDYGITQLQLNSSRIADQRTFVCLQWSKRWSTDSSSAKQRGQALARSMCLRQRLSIVKFFFRRASQLKAMTLGGALSFHNEDQLWGAAKVIDKAEKKEETEKEPSQEGIQDLLSCPSLEPSMPLSTSNRLKRLASSAS